jgi:hypothetical protein
MHVSGIGRVNPIVGTQWMTDITYGRRGGSVKYAFLPMLSIQMVDLLAADGSNIECKMPNGSLLARRVPPTLRLTIHKTMPFTRSQTISCAEELSIRKSALWR